MRDVCRNPEHVGDPLTDRRDLVDRRIEWQGITEKDRWKVRKIRRECKTCVRRELLVIDATPEPEARLFG